MLRGEPPTLTTDELTSKLVELYKPKPGRDDPRWRRKLAAVYGRCDAQVVEVEGQQVRVVPVASELELRGALPDPHADEPLAFVLDYPAIEVPIDIAGRFHKRGKVVRIGKLERLRQLFVGRSEPRKDSLVVLDDELVDSALARYLIGVGDPSGLALTTGRVSLDQAYARWLHAAWFAPERPSLDNLLVFAATNERHASFVAAMGAPEASGVEAELLGVLARSVGPEAALIWRCWLAGRGRALLEFAVLFEAHAALPNEVLHSTLLALASIRVIEDERLGEAMTTLAAALPTALELFVEARSGGAAALRQLLIKAEGYLLKPTLVHLRGSRRLPHAWTLRLDAIGEALAKIAEAPSETDYALLSQRVLELELHDSIALDECKAIYAQAEMARRLAAFLVVRSDRRWAAARGPLGKFEALAGWYTQEGGYVDLARQRVRGASGGEGKFAQGVHAVLAKVDALRVEQDREFAAALPKWLESNRPGRRLLGIDTAIDRWGARFLRSEGGAKRRVLVVVLDGMAWAQAVELLAELGSETTATPWHPLGWNREVAELDPRGAFVPVLASLPTVTEVSRSALFAGEPTTPGVSPRTTDDDARWAKHPSIAPLFAGSSSSRKPTLLVSSEAFDKQGLSAAARAAIADERAPALAVLINTIDKALGSDKLDEAPWTIKRIGPLRELFDAARDAGRVVLLCSDHGNVSGQRLRYAGSGVGGPARWRTLRAGDTIREFEVAIPSPPGWRPPDAGAIGVVLINDDIHAYSAQPHYGEHGGATMAEVLAPTLLLGTPEFARTELGDDPMLALTPISPPLWWLDEVREAEGWRVAIAAETEKQLAKQAAPEPEPKTAQLPLLGVTPAKPEPAPELQARAKAEAETRLAETEAKMREKGKKWVGIADATEKLLDKLESNPLFKARSERSNPGEPDLHNEVVAALAFLLERNDHANGEAFAVHMGKNKVRVAGLVSSLSSVLNVDGYEVLVYEPRAKLVRVNRELLIQGFGL